MAQIFRFVTLLAGMAAIAGPALAQTAATCDPNYYETLKSRAWLEAQREVTQNQNLIAKPDSVLEYTCFDQSMNVLALNANLMFSGSTRWGPVLPPTSMAVALEGLVGSALQTYQTGNFSHSFLGGRSSIDHQFKSIAGGAYNCAVMNAVWMQAKCAGFIEKPDTDGFYTFTHYRDNPDKRQLPFPCPGEARWTPEIQNVETHPGWKQDQVQTFLSQMDYKSCASAKAIPTGIRVMGEEGEYDEKVCIAPGCHYSPKANMCVPNNPKS
ncbi:MAG: hypothetical protein L6Q57_06135 [Alphaproteobacteria bacterium]|nr:hypothetical protein [Alphaproteobacteria bacterium]